MAIDRKSTRLNSSHQIISYAVFCLTPRQPTSILFPYTTLFRSWVEALVQPDTAKLEAIFLDTYVDTDEGGHQSDKQATLAVLKSGDLKFKSIKLSNMKVYTYGDAAVITGMAAQMGLLGATPLSPNLCSPTPLSCKPGRGRRPRHIGLPRQNEIAGRSIRPQAASDRGTFHADLMK